MASIIKANQLQDFGGNSIITSDGAGVVTPNATGIKNTPMFFVNKNSTNTTVAEGTNVKVTDFDEIYDTNNAFASNKFTPGVAGYYYMEGTTSINIANAGSYLQALIYKNGSMIAYQQVVAEGTNATYSVTANVIDLANTTDYYELYIRHNLGQNGSINYSSTGRYTRFLGHKLIGS